MPWNQTSPMDQRTQLIADYLRDRLSALGRLRSFKRRPEERGTPPPSPPEKTFEIRNHLTSKAQFPQSDELPRGTVRCRFQRGAESAEAVFLRPIPH